MTDEQIINALCLCANAQEECRKCPLHSVYSESCIKKLMNTTLDLIKRQQEKIEAIINGQETLSKALVTKDAEIERKKKILDSYALQYGTVTDQSKKIKEIKDEAYKEFAERLKDRIFTVFGTRHYEVELTTDGFDRIVKEMTEGSNG